jgi:hypothetical protein
MLSKSEWVRHFADTLYLDLRPDMRMKEAQMVAESLWLRHRSSHPVSAAREWHARQSQGKLAP